MKRRKLVLAVVGLAWLIVVVFGGACARPAAPPARVTDVSASQALQLMAQNEGNPAFIVLDVRTAAEFSDGHIAGAVNFDVNGPDFRVAVGAQARANTYLVYCRTGNRSRQAIEIMKQLRFERIYHLGGGITEWVDQGLPTLK